MQLGSDFYYTCCYNYNVILHSPLYCLIETCYTLQRTRTRGCIYSCYTPDDGCKKRPKHVEYSTSEIKVTAQLHRVGLFNNDK